jgi:hypothetical protein
LVGETFLWFLIIGAILVSSRSSSNKVILISSDGVSDR